MAEEFEPVLVGRREWVALPDLGLPAIKAKIDTGARTSALHAVDITLAGTDAGPLVKFVTFPLPERPDIEVACTAPLVGEREIISSMGTTESRYIIQTTLFLGHYSWPIEVGLTNRQGLTHRMLVGRKAIPSGMLVDPRRSYLQSRLSSRLYLQGAALED